MADDPIAAFMAEFESGTPVPAVDPADIRRMQEFVSRVRERIPTLKQPEAYASDR
jgi:hypothetical protein